jgi:tripartite-type tricarboxylate transporter receptor subunit TctC
MRHVLLGMVAVTISQPLWAQGDYPNRPVRLIVTSAAGGSGDNIARLVAKLAGAELNAAIVVDNRPGASGIIATETVVRSDPAGYTLLQTSSSLVTNAATGRKLPYDVLRDIMPVANLATAEGYLLLANPGLGVASVKDLINLAKKRTLQYGSPGVGNPIHFHMEAFAQRAGIQLNHIPYKGLAPALTSLISGEIQLLLAPPIATKGYIDAGRMQALGVISRQRVSALPNVPTMEELGFKGFYLLGGWQGVFAPAAIPPRVLEKLHAAIRRAVLSDEFRTFAQNGGYVPDGSSPAEFRKRLVADYQGFREISKLVEMEKN